MVGGWLVTLALANVDHYLANPSKAAADAADSPEDTLSTLDSGCEKEPTYLIAVPECDLRYNKPPKGTTENPPSEAKPGLHKIDETQAGACPALANDPPPDLFVVCVPTYLAGKFDAGSKSVIVVPGAPSSRPRSVRASMLRPHPRSRPVARSWSSAAPSRA